MARTTGAPSIASMVSRADFRSRFKDSSAVAARSNSMRPLMDAMESFRTPPSMTKTRQG